jgi:sigma-B regulation protein RsbU (phosphoserine phosphatase)
MPASLRSKASGYLLAILGVVAVTAIGVLLRAHVNATTAALAFVLVVLFSAMAWGSLPALVASVLAMLGFNYFFLPPIGTLTIADPENWIALAAFFITAVAGGQLSARVKQRAADARTLARLQAVVADLGQRALRPNPGVNVLDEAVRLVATALDVDFTNIMELLADRKVFLLRAGVGWKEGQVGHTIVPIAGTQPGFTLRSEQVVVVKNAAGESRFHPVAETLGENVASTMSVVISTTEGPYGTFGVHTRTPRAFTKDEVNFLQSIANVLGATIERQRDDDALRESETSLSRAQEVAHLGSWHLDVPHDRLTWSDEVFRIFDVKNGTQLTYQAFLEFIHPDDRKRVDDAWSAAMRGAPYDVEHRILIGGETKWVRERAHVTFDDKGVAIEGLGTVQDVTEHRLAARTAELEAARKRESVIGSRIQQMLLMDRPPLEVPGLHVAALSIPSQQIDGDFYDFYQHEDQTVDVIVADVMGKGIPAALLGAATKSHFIEALCHLMGTAGAGVLPQPREIVTQAHAEMVQHLIELESFVTLCYARFDLSRKTVTMVDCGHTGLIHWHATTRTCAIVHGNNVPLGIREGEIYDQIEVAFEPGDVMLLFSDGVTDARNREGESFGEQRLVECLRANSALEPRELVEVVRKAAFDFSATTILKDDLTCLAIRIAPHELPLAHSALELRSDLRDLARARQFVREICGKQGASLDDDGICELELAVTEACSNIVKHAYHGRNDQWIRLEGDAYPGSVSLQLHYFGDPFDPSKVLPPAFDGSRDSGFGVYLITKSVDDVRYYRDERGRNCVALQKRRVKRNEARASWIS